MAAQLRLRQGVNPHTVVQIVENYQDLEGGFFVIRHDPNLDGKQPCPQADCLCTHPDCRNSHTLYGIDELRLEGCTMLCNDRIVVDPEIGPERVGQMTSADFDTEYDGIEVY